MDRCPHCGEFLRDWIFLRGIALQGNQKLIYESVKKAGENGIHADRLFDILYGHDPNGGPDFETLAATVAHLNKKLRQQGEKVTAGHGRRFYRLVQS